MKRKLRKLYQSAIGKLINTDVNGALNIMRKYFQNLSVACDSLIQEIMDNTKGSKTLKNFKGFWQWLVFQSARMFVHSHKSSHKGIPIHITK